MRIQKRLNFSNLHWAIVKAAANNHRGTCQFWSHLRAHLTGTDPESRHNPSHPIAGPTPFWEGMSGPVSRRCPLIFSLSIWKSCIFVFLLFAQLDKEQKGIQTNLRLSLSPPTVRGVVCLVWNGTSFRNQDHSWLFFRSLVDCWLLVCMIYVSHEIQAESWS